MGKVKIFSGKAKAAACAACAGFHRAHTCGKVPLKGKVLLKQKPAVKASSGCAACRGSHRAHTVRHSVGAARAGEGRDLLGYIRSPSQIRFSSVAFHGRAGRSPGPWLAFVSVLQCVDKGGPRPVLPGCRACAGRPQMRVVQSFSCRPVCFVWITTNELHRGAWK